jgi:16S rRNA (guanine966-N2)-methyltransferase
MRIIGGKFKGRRFDLPAGKWPTRPTTDVAREGLFNILENILDFESLKALDLFSGTGGHSYELISRGAAQATCVDRFGPALAFVKQVAQMLGAEGQIYTVKADVLRFIASCRESFDYVFADPPFDMPGIESLPDRIFESGILRPGAWFVLEHNNQHRFDTHPRFQRQRAYGQVCFSFFRAEEPSAS